MNYFRYLKAFIINDYCKKRNFLSFLRVILWDEKLNQKRKYYLDKKSNEIFKKIKNLNNNCNNVGSLICHVNQYCGYLCQLHFYIICHIQAYYTNRSVIFRDLDPKVDRDIGSHIKLIPDINRFKDSFSLHETCSFDANDVYEVQSKVFLTFPKEMASNYNFFYIS